MSSLSLVSLTENDVQGAKLVGRTVEEHSVVQLRRWLLCRGVNSQGKKPDLVAKVKDVQRTNYDWIDPAIDGGKWYEAKKKQLEGGTQNVHENWVVNCDAGPSSDKEDVEWTPFTSKTQLPSLFNNGHIYHWIIESVGELSSEHGHLAVTEKPMRRGKQYKDSGWVTDVECVTSKDKSHFRSVILASFSAVQHRVSVTLSKNSGCVLDASCDCKSSGLKRCSHVAALLLVISDDSCTSEACQWNKGSKRKDPGSVLVKSYSKKVSVKSVGTFDPRPKQFRSPDEKSKKEAINKFRTHLEEVNFLESPRITSMWETTLCVTQVDELVLHKAPFQKAEEFFREHNDHVCTDICYSHFVIMMRYSGSEVSGIEILTRGQNQNEHWHQFRKGLLTASQYKLICQSKCFEKTAAALLAGSRLNELHLPAPIQYGRQNEEKARNLFLEVHQSHHKNVECTVPGLYINDCENYPFLGASPDGIVLCATCGKFLVEVKCLYKNRFLDAKSALIESGACQQVGLEIILNKGHAFYYQIQGQLHVTKLSKCVLIAFTSKGIYTVDVIYDEEWTQVHLLPKLSSFHKQQFFSKSALNYTVEHEMSALS